MRSYPGNVYPGLGGPNPAGPAAGGYACPPADTVVGPTNYVVNDYYHPQVVPVIHPIEIINQHHCVPIPKHYYTCKTKDVFVQDYRRSSNRK